MFIIEQSRDNHLPLCIWCEDTLCLSLNNLETITYHCVSGVYHWTIWRQLLTTAYLVIGYILFIIEQSGDNHLPLRISWQDTLCLSLNNLETITYHCVSGDRIHCVYPWIIWRQSLTSAYLVAEYIVFILEQPGDNYLQMRISWQDTLCLSLNNLRQSRNTTHISWQDTFCLSLNNLETIT